MSQSSVKNGTVVILERVGVQGRRKPVDQQANHLTSQAKNGRPSFLVERGKNIIYLRQPTSDRWKRRSSMLNPIHRSIGNDTTLDELHAPKPPAPSPLGSHTQILMEVWWRDVRRGHGDLEAAAHSSLRINLATGSPDRSHIGRHRPSGCHCFD